MKRLFTLSLFLLICSLAICQESDKYAIFKRFDYTRARRIIDSIWTNQKLWEKTNLITSLEEASKVQFIIIPIVEFTKNVSDYNREHSLIEYLQISNNSLSAYLVYNENFIGYIKVCFAMSYESKINMDSTFNVIDLINESYRRNKDTTTAHRWQILETEFGNNSTPFNHSKSFYNVIKANKPTYYFTFFNAWELWFFENNKLKAMSIFRDKTVKEKELIKGVKKYVENDQDRFYLEYVGK